MFLTAAVPSNRLRQPIKTPGFGEPERNELVKRAAGDRLLMASCLGLFALAWLTFLNLTSLSPPTDNIEQLTWVGSLEWGYYKHPPLPTWLFWLPVHWWGATAFTSYLAGALCTLGAMVLLWVLVRQLRSARYATVATLSALCITYYNDRLYYFNHNVVLMLVSAAAAAIYWQAHRSERTAWWFALGVTLGLGALAKYQIAVTAICILVFWSQQGSWRRGSQRRGLLLAALIALVIFSPHVLWLQQHDFGPVHYAIDSSLGYRLGPVDRTITTAHWLLDQLFNRALPAWLLLGAVACALGRSNRNAELQCEGKRRTLAAGANASALYLLTWGIVPLAFVVGMGLLEGTELPLHWGTPFLLFAAPAVMELCSSLVNWHATKLRHALLPFLVLQALVMAQDAMTSPYGWDRVKDQHWEAFPSAALANRIEGAADTHAHGPVCLVSGPPAVARALALRMPDRPKVLINGRADISPWVQSADIRHCNTLEVRQKAAGPGWNTAAPDFPEISWRITSAAPQQ